MSKYIIGILSAAALLSTIFLANIIQTNASKISPSEMRALISGPQSLYLLEWQQLEKDAGADDPVAWNNYGVALHRTPNQRNKEKAMGLFDRAAQAGVVAARYNLALTLPNKFATAPEIIRKQIDLLQENVALGDIHSMVALNKALYFRNRDAYVTDRLALKRSLLKTAADSGDTDYIYIYGNELMHQTSANEDPVFLTDAIAAFLQVDAAGDPRGAKALGDILRFDNPLYKKSIEQSDLTGSVFDWYARAGDLGSITARCAYGNNVFRFQRFLKLGDTLFPIIKAHFSAAADVQRNPPEVIERAISDLEQCAKAKKLPSKLYRPFGDPALYIYKQQGTRTALFNSPGHANVSLGVLYGFGIIVQRDHDLAVRYLTEAIETHGFVEAKSILKALPDY